MRKPANFIVRIHHDPESQPGTYVATVIEAPMFFGKELRQEFRLEVEQIKRYYRRCVPQETGEGLCLPLRGKTAEQLGQQLYRALFPDGKMGDYYRENLSTLEGAGGLCLHLWLEAEELSDLPWECLSLLDDAHRPIVIRGIAQSHQSKRQKHTKIIVATANPEGAQPLNLEQEWEIIDAQKREWERTIGAQRQQTARSIASDQHQQRTAYEVIEIRGATKEKLVESFRNLQGQCGFIFYFSGHGAIETGESVLVLHDGYKLSAGELIDILPKGRPECEFVVLNACHSAPIAEQLVRAGIAGACGVAGKWPEWPETVALDFARGFWDGLRETGLSEVAVDRGRHYVTRSRPELAAMVRLYGVHTARPKSWYVQPPGVYDIRKDLRRFVRGILQPARWGKGDKRILMIRDVDRAGKSFLLKRMAEQCQKLGDHATLIDFRQLRERYEKSGEREKLESQPEIYLAREILKELGDEESPWETERNIKTLGRDRLLTIFWERLQAIVEERSRTHRVVVLLFDLSNGREYAKMEDWVLRAVCVPLNRAIRQQEEGRKGLAVVIAGRNSLFLDQGPAESDGYRGPLRLYWRALYKHPEVKVSRLTEKDIEDWMRDRHGYVHRETVSRIGEETGWVAGNVETAIDKIASYPPVTVQQNGGSWRRKPPPQASDLTTSYADASEGAGA